MKVSICLILGAVGSILEICKRRKKKKGRKHSVSVRQQRGCNQTVRAVEEIEIEGGGDEGGGHQEGEAVVGTMVAAVMTRTTTTTKEGEPGQRSNSNDDGNNNNNNNKIPMIAMYLLSELTSTITFLPPHLGMIHLEVTGGSLTVSPPPPPPPSLQTPSSP